ncbi:glycosyltransferase, partial [Streptomyces litchfieldiae]|nr:hypothetical protein [Streptomyces sp. DSM 44938]
AAARMVQLPPGVDEKTFHPGSGGDEVRARLGLTDRPVVVCVSRLVPRKGQDTLIRAMPAILAAEPDAVLLIDDRAVIHHRVPAAREHFGYFRARTYAEGLSKALVARSVGVGKGLESERRYTTRVLPAGVVRGLRDAVLARP